MPYTNLFSLQEKVIIVTGGTGVLGEAFIRGIHEAGGSVVILGRNQEEGEARAEELRAAGGQAIFAKADVLNEADLIAARDLTLQTYGRIDGLVNGAGGNLAGAVIQPDQNLFDMDLPALRQAFELNLFGTLQPTLIFGKWIAESERGGSIVNISSMAAQSAITRVLGYSMAKGSVDNFTRWMSVELAQRYGDKVRMNAIAPGFFITHQNRDLLTNQDGSYTTRGAAVIRNTPYQRFGKPDELIGALVWLLSDASAFVSGEIVSVDGGFSVFSGV
ncbi:NAD(P)-dependent dehydrogenase, short-chain alcohol dehydrogenase family [Catalinimonas alkaloidigena]|uniref:NAD(P)-dependent dehydrogenase, short-chain alcohol dehydrogenase family n=1 Tax=Catalinimonas alkaloidigena TaxID=1075417 RepID=A0A1G8Y5D6_9BACT|nr:SDR family oxidoreductase [Catalinimonas alkaloidigena]SDJ97290.1 NAD(P)-dependent dehydrogenase, short-chain alcohol dehydrogenase family [Catalinimonas alkaloidigena]